LRRTVPWIVRAEPNRVKLLMEMDEPQATKLRTDSELPNLIHSIMLTELPIRAKPRRLKALPKLVKSKTDSPVPKRCCHFKSDPKILKPDATRENDLSESELPKLM
jgi:hypothetical protein